MQIIYELKNKIKRIRTGLLLFTALLLFTGNALSQTVFRAVPPEEQRKETVDALSKLVTLTASERTQVEAILKDAHDRMQALGNGANTERIIAIYEEQNRKIKELLGEARYAKYLETGPQVKPL